MRIQEPIRYPTFWRTVGKSLIISAYFSLLGLVHPPMFGFTNVSRPMYFAGDAVAKLVMEIPLPFQWVRFLVSKEALSHSRFL